jgi:hypothetical protein
LARKDITLLKQLLKQQGLKATRQAATLRQTQQLNRQQLRPQDLKATQQAALQLRMRQLNRQQPKMQRPTQQAHKAIMQLREQRSRLLSHRRVLKAITQRRPGRLDMMLLEQQQREQQDRGTEQQLQPLKDTRLNEHQQSDQRQSEPQRKVTAQSEQQHNKLQLEAIMLQRRQLRAMRLNKQQQREQQQKGPQLRVIMLKKRRQRELQQRAMGQSVLRVLVLLQQIALPQGS